jgi:integrase
LEKTSALRNNSSSDQLLISYVKPYKPVSVDTLSRWTKVVLKASGIDIKSFGSHSTRSASTSSLASKGIPVDFIIKSVGWSNASTFAKFYNKPIDTDRQNFGDILLRMNDIL